MESTAMCNSWKSGAGLPLDIPPVSAVDEIIVFVISRG